MTNINISYIPSMINMECSCGASKITQKQSSIFTSVEKYCNILILLPLMHVILLLTLTLSLLSSNRTRMYVKYPKLKDQMLTEFYNALLDSLLGRIFKITVIGNQLQKCRITVSDIDWADSIYGPKDASLKG